MAPRRAPKAGKAAAPVNLAAPAWLKSAGPNLARKARVSTPGAANTGVRTELLLNDGDGVVENNATRWLNRGPLPHWIEFTWDQPVSVGAARIISGYYTGGGVTGAVEAFTLSWQDGSVWRELKTVRGNTLPAWSGTFPAATTTKVRLGITATREDTSRIWEVELYAPVAE